MNNNRDDGFDGHDLDPETVLWVPGEELRGGWLARRSQAPTELSNALTAAAIDTTGAHLRASASTDGSGVL
ncbi:hypothetical protein ACIBLA_27030 [Streptomyces sp. NPDC050433]|uniref:hypothetical protein n=1 Tax=unclassified Streptomyces TaxID=2593676 RepID=UPI00343281E9